MDQELDCIHLNEKGEDNRLNNWKKWIEIRKQFHQKMYDIQRRRPSDLVINSMKDTRLLNETLMRYEYTKIPKVASKRGKPSFWYFPPKSSKFPSLISVMPKRLDYEVPEIETVGIPTVVRREMDAQTSAKAKHSKWFDSKYLHKRSKQLAHELKRVKSHIPKTDNLVVTGKPLQREECKEEIEPAGVEEETPKTDGGNESDSSDDSISLKVPIKSLQIEEATFTANGHQDIKRKLEFINFEIGKDEIVTRSVSLKNIGNVNLRYYWHRQCFSQNDPLLKNLIPRRLPMYGFIFTKNECILLPNNTNDLKIGFMTNKPGFYKEIWELRTSPSVFEGNNMNGKFTLELYAYADISDFEESEAAIVNRIEEGMKYSSIEETLLCILRRTQAITTEMNEDGRKIVEKDLFESINARFGPPGSLPLVYHYNEPIVRKLKNMYIALRTEEDPPYWNYKIDEVEILINKCTSIDEKNYYKFAFNELVKGIFKTNMVENEQRIKYQNIYDLLCIMVDRMSDKVFELRYKHKMVTSEIYPAVTKEMLLRQEYLDDNYRSTLYFSDLVVDAAIKRVQECPIDETGMAFMNILKSIPFENVEERYKVYQKEKYGIDVDKVVAKGKGDKKKEVKDEKKPDPKDANKNRKESTVRVENSLSHLLRDTVQILPEYSRESLEYYSESLRLYYYDLYVFIYLLLCQAVDEIQCVLEYKLSTKKLTRQIIRNCIEFGIPTLPEPQDIISQRDFNGILMRNLDTWSFDTDSSITTPSRTTLTSDISKKSYASFDKEFLKPISSFINIPSEVELVDAQTETDGEELYPLRIKVGNIQTDDDDEEFDLVAQVERQLSATSVQYMTKTTEEKATQVETCTQIVIEESMMGEGFSTRGGIVILLPSQDATATLHCSMDLETSATGLHCIVWHTYKYCIYC